MKCSIGLSPSRLVPTHFAASLTSSSSLRHALSGLLTSAKRFADPRGLKEKAKTAPRPERGKTRPKVGRSGDRAEKRHPARALGTTGAPEWRQSGENGAKAENHPRTGVKTE